MNKMHRSIIILTIILAFICNFSLLNACTTGLAAPNAANNNQALLWKNRDSGFNKNEVAFFRNGTVTYIGLINADDTTQVWAGVNNFGFAIMNAESRDMALPGENTGYDDEGVWMKAALRQCRTVADFEKMLRRSNYSGRKVTSNFGVIDAMGNAAFFETGNHEYFRFDADEPGYLVRANFAYKARSSEGYGKVRHARAVTLIDEAVCDGRLDHRYLISTVSRDITLPDSLIDASQPNRRKTSDTINRHRTVSAAIFTGYVDKTPALTTFWCTLGEPAVALAVPLWVRSAQIPVELNGTGGALLNAAFMDIKNAVYADPTHIDLGKLRQIRQIFDQTQDKIFRKTARQLKRWEKNLPEPAEMAVFQDKMVSMALRAARKALHYLGHPAGQFDSTAPNN